MTEIQTPAVASEKIAGVYHVAVRVFADERGRFMETFRSEWFPQVSWARLQTNRSDSHTGVLRGLHYHHRQVDYWYVPAGRVRVALVDVRPASPTFGAVETLDLGAENNAGLFIPTGVAHGFAAHTDATLMYIVNQYYDSSDELGIAWDDPDLGIDWGVSQPLLSDRDRSNPRLRALPRETLPR
jgi:dTDP-4-dehydrorhamnose 3,5-epimerase